MKVTIDVFLPKEIDMEHAYQSITDALDWSDNVTSYEYHFINDILNEIKNKLNHD